MFLIRNPKAVIDCIIAVVESFITWCALIAYASPSYALPDDQFKTLNIISDKWVYDYKKGTHLYEGNVIVNQGSTHLTADRLIAKINQQHKIDEAIAYGFQTQAHYWTIPNPGEPMVHARAKIIRFYPVKSMVSLQGEVSVIQGENRFQGERIFYNMKDKIITVPPSKNSRSVLTYHPTK